MSISYVAIKTKCILWKNIQLPRPDKSLKSSVFRLDGFTWNFEVNCFKQQNPSFKIEEMFTFALKCRTDSYSSNHVIIPYIEAEGNYVRLAPTIKDTNFWRSTFSKNAGIDGDTVTMLFFLSQHSLSTEQNFKETPLVITIKNEDSGKTELKSEYVESVSKDFEQLFNNMKYSDAIVKSGDGSTSFFVHKNILTAQSDVFRAMFDCDMAEKNSGIIIIDDVEPTILKLFLQCLYSGKLETISIESTISLYLAADEYVVESLKKQCTSYLLNNVSNESVCKILLLADKVNDTELFNGVASFAANDDEFLKTQEWMDFALQHSNVAVKVCLKFISKTSLF